jgi:hypothetical protein
MFAFEFEFANIFEIKLDSAKSKTFVFMLGPQRPLAVLFTHIVFVLILTFRKKEPLKFKKLTDRTMTEQCFQPFGRQITRRICYHFAKIF